MTTYFQEFRCHKIILKLGQTVWDTYGKSKELSSSYSQLLGNTLQNVTENCKQFLAKMQ